MTSRMIDCTQGCPNCPKVETCPIKEAMTYAIAHRTEYEAFHEQIVDKLAEVALDCTSMHLIADPDACNGIGAAVNAAALTAWAALKRQDPDHDIPDTFKNAFDK